MRRSEAHEICNGPRTRALSMFIMEMEELYERALTADQSDPTLVLAPGSRTAHTYIRKNFRALLKAMDYTMSYGCLSKSKSDIVYAKKEDKLAACQKRREAASLNPELKEEYKKLVEEESKLAYDLKVSTKIRAKEDIARLKKEIEDKKKGTSIKRSPNKHGLKNI